MGVARQISEKYVFKPYQLVFPVLFEKERKRLKKVLKELPVIHMGSTAVPNLGGKGIIDIYIPVDRKNMKDVSNLVQSLGYQFCPDSGSKYRLFHKQDLPDPIDRIRRYHVHVVWQDSPDFMSSLVFRNYLRNHSEAAEKYARIKEYAASIAGESKQIYMSTKEGVIKHIIKDNFYEAVGNIPKGKVTTYGQLARACGLKAPRYAGYLLSQNTTPKTVPCHRVIHSSGILAGNYAFGGLEAKKKKLEAEGVEIKNNKVDLTKYGWKPIVKVDE